MAMLQKRLSRKAENKTYYKWAVNLPNEIIDKSGFKEGDIFDVKATRGKIVLSVEGKKKSRRNDFVKAKAFGIGRLQKGIEIFNSSMENLERTYGEEIPTDKLEKELLKKLSKAEIDHVVGTLFINGDCFFPKKDFIKRI